MARPAIVPIMDPVIQGRSGAFVVFDLVNQAAQYCAVDLIDVDNQSRCGAWFGFSFQHF